MNNSKIAFQHEFCQELPYEVRGTKEYAEYQSIFDRIDEIITISNIERELCDYFQSQLRNKKERKKQADAQWISAQQIVRLGVARKLRGESLREFSRSLAESMILQRFCRLVKFGSNKVHIPGKSALCDYEKMVPPEIMNAMNTLLIQSAHKESSATQIGLAKPVSLANCYLDTTCLEGNVHYPVDWVLLRDATRSLIKAIITIRKRGLFNRMPQEPKEFMRDMNKLAIQMAYAARRAKEGKKKRKQLLRKMKKFLRAIENHAIKHRDVLKARWRETDLAEGDAHQIIKRIDTIVDQVDAVIRQAHRRIISGGKVKNEEKILSLYEPDIHVVVRKKSGKEVEFGNVLSIAEQEDGLIIDWALYQEKVPADAKILPERVEKIEKHFGDGVIEQITTDRGFPSKDNKKYLAKKNITNNMCPRAVVELEERLEDEGFIVHQRRRAQTEARIGIFKNVFLGRPLRNKGFEYRNGGVGWCLLAHNLWVLARSSLDAHKNEPINRAA